MRGPSEVSVLLRSFSYSSFRWALRQWDAGTILDRLGDCYLRTPQARDAESAGIIGATLVERSPPSWSWDSKDLLPGLIIHLDPKVFLQKSEQQQEAYMRRMVLVTGLDELRISSQNFAAKTRTMFGRAGLMCSTTSRLLSCTSKNVDRKRSRRHGCRLKEKLICT
jgi:hypothetical protein